MRDALNRGAHCAGANRPDRYSVLDTFAFTNTPYARKDPVMTPEGPKPDALHYGHNTTLMEAVFLLNMICPREAVHKQSMPRSTDAYRYPTSPREQEATVLQGPDPPDKGCGPQNYNQQLAQATTALTLEPSRKP